MIHMYHNDSRCIFIDTDAHLLKMIKKIGSKYVVLSETTRRKFGTYKTKKEALKRLRQIEFFKHLKSSPGLRRGLRKKSLLK